jgi:hypothetical protein
MVEPTFPAGAAIAAFVMTIISWYNMLRTGIQLVHDDLEARKSVEEDIRNMLVDLVYQETALNDWKRSWRISKQTPNVVLLQYWGAKRLHIINEKLKRMKADLGKARDKLGRLAEMEEGHWSDIGKAKRKYYKAMFILVKKKHVQDLIDRWPKNMTVIKEEADAGWLEQQQPRAREVAHSTPYHIQVAHLLVQIAMQNRNDAEALRGCCEGVQDEVAVLLDLDVFDVIAAVTEDKDVERIAQVFKAGHLKLELLLREADRQQAELTRVVVERAPNGAMPEGRVVDAFTAILGTAECKRHFASNASTLFCLSKIRRTGDPCSRLQKTFREVLSSQDPPRYDAAAGQFVDHELVLGELSNSRAAFELAQACLLFLRTTWIAELCRCGLRCGALPSSPTVKWYQFGLEMIGTRHQPPLWRNPYDHERYVEGTLNHSWCTTNYHWDGLNKPLRHLGLLLVEFTLSTIVFPQTNGSVDGAAPVANIHVLVRAEPGPWRWEIISIKTVSKLVKQFFNDDEHITKAVEHCLTGSFPSSPSDAEWEIHLRRFYFKVVKPYVLLIYSVFLSLTCSVSGIYTIYVLAAAPFYSERTDFEPEPYRVFCGHR